MQAGKSRQESAADQLIVNKTPRIWQSYGCGRAQDLQGKNDELSFPFLAHYYSGTDHDLELSDRQTASLISLELKNLPVYADNLRTWGHEELIVLQLLSYNKAQLQEIVQDIYEMFYLVLMRN